MDNRRHIRHSARHFGFSYPTSLSQRVHSAFAPLVVVVIIFIFLRVSAILPVTPAAVAWPTLLGALMATFIRLAVGYVIALVVAVPLVLLVDRSPLMERIFLPIFDIAQSVPVLAFFPIVIIFFLHFGFTDGAAIFIIFLTMLWSIVFSLFAGVKVIPGDIKAAAQVFGIKGTAYIRRILIPATVPYLITGSLLAWAGGWNIIIVAEVLHTYIPGATSSIDLPGLGSMLVNATAQGENGVFLIALFAMIVVIALLNFFVWQKLLHYAERYKFE